MSKPCYCLVCRLPPWRVSDASALVREVTTRVQIAEGMLASGGPSFGRSRGVPGLTLLPLLLPLLLALITRPDVVASVRTGAAAVDDGCTRNGVVAVHLVPQDTDPAVNPGPDRLFRWRCTVDREAEAPCRIELVNNSKMRIICPGMYFVYSQIAYKTNRSVAMIGHSTVKFKRHFSSVRGEVRKASVLMASTLVRSSGAGCQVEGSPCGCFETSYHGGVFFLAKDEEVAVRPFDAYMNTADFCLGHNEVFLGAWCMEPLSRRASP
ncbi:uncharacterized protein LOC133341213 isoform X2 [Lethenteron reissneri]|uniref:uncharacterized protein LOC133341213 isoform X2 n=1 Tax=Lethenteron reissneri TaxID=7753 RepID=UPI002AB66FFA|nr:uncharacterized protein LOC133341213 isoform X2 [Lethenteron reissneri]XP_061405676.1 uncharacterized protein LOC133341213 isoform X2 [Lethenteron reissneri]